MLSTAGTSNAGHRILGHQIPAELIQLDPDCISKVRTTSIPCEGVGEEEGRGKRKRQSRGKAGGKSEALKRQKRKEEQGKVGEVALYHNVNLSYPACRPSRGRLCMLSSAEKGKDTQVRRKAVKREAVKTAGVKMSLRNLKTSTYWTGSGDCYHYYFDTYNHVCHCQR